MHGILYSYEKWKSIQLRTTENYTAAENGCLYSYERKGHYIATKQTGKNIATQKRICIWLRKREKYIATKKNGILNGYEKRKHCIATQNCFSGYKERICIWLRTTEAYITTKNWKFYGYKKYKYIATKHGKLYSCEERKIYSYKNETHISMKKTLCGQ